MGKQQPLVKKTEEEIVRTYIEAVNLTKNHEAINLWSNTG